MKAPSSVRTQDATPAAAPPEHPQFAVTDPPTVTCEGDTVTKGPSANCLNSTLAVAGVPGYRTGLPATSVEVTASA